MGKPSDPMSEVAAALNALALELRRYNDRNDIHIRQDSRSDAELGTATYGEDKDRDIRNYFQTIETLERRTEPRRRSA